MYPAMYLSTFFSSSVLSRGTAVTHGVGVSVTGYFIFVNAFMMMSVTA